MRLVLQRVENAGVRVAGLDHRPIGRGLVILVGVGPQDDEAVARRMAEKAVLLRVFPNAEGKFDRSLKDINGAALVVSQFTLYGDCRKGRRPDFTGAMPPDKAKPLYESFVSALKAQGVQVTTGEFGARMQVDLINDGPMTLWLDSEM